MGLGPNDRRLSAYHIRRACEASLRRLQTDHIDLYQMHHVDRATPWEEIWQAMEQLVREGKVTYVGSSNFAGWDVALAQSAASARHFLGLTSEQSLYNLAVRSRGAGADPRAAPPRHRPDPVQPAARRAAGRRAAKPPPGTRRRTSASTRTATSSRRTKGCAGSLGAKPADVALAWLLRNPVVSAAIVGARTIEELRVGPRRAVGAAGRRRSGSTRPDLARTGGSPAGVRLVGRRRAPSLPLLRVGFLAGPSAAPCGW